MALINCEGCGDEFEEGALVAGRCRFCVKKRSRLGISKRPLIPCRGCSGLQFWRRLVLSPGPHEMEQIICKQCGLTEHYANNLETIEESDTCVSFEITSRGPFR